MQTPSPLRRHRARLKARAPKARSLPEAQPDPAFAASAAPAARAPWWPWLLALVALVALVWLLAPILTPFILGGVLAYVGNPLVARLGRAGVPKALAAVGVLALVVAWLLLLVVIIVPLVREEASRIAEKLPQALALFNETVAPRLKAMTGMELSLDPRVLQNLAVDNWDVIQPVLQRLFESLRIGGGALAGIVLNAMLAPVVAFYMLQDDGRLGARLAALIPPRWRDKTLRLAGDIDGMLSGFLRGQMLVMFALAAYYALALALAGLPSALPVGLLTGMLIFIPYIGYATGLALALSIAVLQFAGWPPVLWVLAIYGVGQVLESLLLTPYLVGDRIGLSPLAAIFALMAFGQLFGFFGVLVALPVAAAIVVALRELRAAWLGSHVFNGP